MTDTEERPRITPALLKAKEAAVYLNVGIATFWRMVTARQLRPTGKGRLTRFAVKELDRYIALNTRERK